jgi:tRNA(Ile)-lysidine synthase
VLHAVARSLRTLAPGERLGVALSGGRDSVALLDAAVASGVVPVDRIVALHVHHGLSKHADAWADYCIAFAARLGVACATKHVAVAGAERHGVESAARTARYEALRAAARECRVAVIALAHHQDDQAETLLLQLFRGAGAHGLAAMSHDRYADAIRWLRPLLDVDRAAIDGYVAARGLAHVDDDSNASDRHRRNALRRRVVPAIEEVFEGYPATVARAARHQAEAARLADDLAAIDAGDALAGDTLEHAVLVALPPHRARNLLRWFLRQHGLRPPSTARLTAMLDQLATPRLDARIRIAHDGAVLGVHRGRIAIHADAPPPYRCEWRGEPYLELPHGRLAFVATLGTGLAAHAAGAGTLVVRPRSGGERLQPHADRPRRALKSWLHEAGMPSWQREAVPLLFDGDTLVAVPGIGVDVAFQARAGEPGWRLDWRPRDAADG